jgi:putative Mg2+ transporter-C (MgtC) family protein
VIVEAELIARIAVAAAVGVGLGIEREVRGQPAGMRTHGLVACGAAIFTLAGAYGFSDIRRGPNVDPMRVAAQVASGIGFIGGGVILKEGASVRGVTTAASLWAAGALGLLVGAGLLAEAVASLGIILVMLVGLRVVTLQYEQGHGTLRPLLDAVRAAGASVEDVWIDDATASGASVRAVRVVVRTAHVAALGRAVAEIGTLSEVQDVHVGAVPN